MTIKAFLDLIADGDWRLENGCLTDDNEDCPLWHAYRLVDPDKDGDAEDYIDAGVRIGLRRTTASAIAAAADERGEPALRKRLLKACGLTP